MGSHTLTCTPQPHTLPSHITWLESQQALQVAKAQVMQLWDQPWALPVLTLTWSSRAAEWATLELVQAGNQEVLHPITNPLSHKSPKSLMVWKPDAAIGHSRDGQAFSLPQLCCIHYQWKGSCFRNCNPGLQGIKMNQQRNIVTKPTSAFFLFFVF